MQICLCGGVCDQFVVNSVTDVRAMEGINPKYLARFGLVQGRGLQ